MQRGSQARHDPDEQRRPYGEPQRALVAEHGDALPLWKELRPQDGAAPVRDHHAEHTAEEREEHALGEQLAEQAAAGDAEREPHRDLPPTPQGAREQQVRDVRRRDEQHDDGDPAHPPRDLRHR